MGKHLASLVDTESIYLKVWSSVAKDIVLSLQDDLGSSGGNTFDVTQNHSGNSNWEVLESQFRRPHPFLMLTLQKGFYYLLQGETGTA